MTATTHIIFATASYMTFSAMFGKNIDVENFFAVKNIIVLVLSCLIPDIDTPKSKFGKLFYFISYKIETHWGHRKITHSFLFFLALAIIFYLLFFIPQINQQKFLLIPFSIGFLSHIFLDTINKQGVCLFYPAEVWCVLPKNQKYRIQVGSNAEWVFLGILIIGTISIYPVSQKGLIKSLHYVMADIQSAVVDFQDYSLTNEVFANIVAADNLTNKKVEGVYRVLGCQGKNILIIEDKNKKLKSIGEYEDNNLRPIKIRINKGENITYIIQKVELKYCQLNKLKEYLNNDYEQRIFGSIEPLNKLNLFLPPEYYSPIKIQNGNLIFNFAKYENILENELENIYIKKAELIIKTTLKNGEEYIQTKKIVKEKLEEFNNKFEVILTVEDKNEILIEKGDKVRKGQIIADIKRQETNIKIKETELYNLEKIKENLDDKLEIEKRKLNIKKLEYELKTVNNEWQQGQIQNKNEIEKKENELKLLKAEKDLQKKKFQKIEEMKTDNDISNLEKEIRDLKNNINKIPEGINNRSSKINDEIVFLNNEIVYLEKKRLEDLVKVEKDITKIKLEIADLKNKKTIKSPVNGVVAEIDYTMSIEYLTRANITILESKKK